VGKFLDVQTVNETLYTIQQDRHTSEDVTVLELYLSKSLSMISTPVKDKLKTGQVHPEGFTSLSQYKLHQGIRKRRLVTDPVSNLVNSGNFSLLREAVEADVVRLKKDEVKMLLVNRQTKIVLACLKKTRQCSSSTHPLLNRFDVIAEVCKLFKDVELIPDAIHIFSMINQVDIESTHYEQLICFIDELIQPPKDNSNSLAKAVSPMGLCVVLSDFLDSIKSFSRHFHLDIEVVSQGLVTVAEGINNEITTLKELEGIYSDRPLGTNKLIELLVNKPTKYRAFLSSPLTKQLTIKSWTGNFSFSLGLNQCSYITKSANKHRKPKKLWRLHTKPLKQKSFSFLQLQSWIYNCNVRHYLETLTSVVLMCFLLNLLVDYVDVAKSVPKPLDTTPDEGDAFNTKFNRITESQDNRFLPFMLLIGLQSLIQILYKVKTDIISLTDSRGFFDILIFLAASFIRLRVFGSYEDQSNNDSNIYGSLWAIITFSLAMRVFLCFSVDHKFGPILRMLYSAFIDASRFLMIFGMILVVFAASFFVLFYKTPEYGTLQDSVFTLVSAALGSFDYYVFVDDEYLGYVLLNVWLVIASILILNMLIAFLSARYEEMAPQTNADYVSVIFVFMQTTRFTPEYGGLVMFPLPLTLLLIPFIPLYFVPIDKQRLSAFLAKLSYFPVFLIAVLCFALHCALWSAYSYFKILWMLASDPSKVRLIKRVRNLLNWVLTAPFYLTFLSFASFPVLTRFLFVQGKEATLSLFTENTEGLTLSTLQKRLNLSPSQEEVPIQEALELFDPSSYIEQVDTKARLVIGASNLFSNVVQTPHLRLSYSEEARRRKELRAYKVMVMKLASFNSQTLNLKEAVQLLQDSPSSLQTYSRYITEKVLASLKDASKLCDS
jgi:hypothetical protein